MNRSLSPCVCLLALLVTQGCDRGESPLTPSGAATLRLEDIASSASTPDAVGALRTGLPPADGTGPVITVTANQTIVNGGTMAAAVQAAAPVSKLLVYIGAKAVGLIAESQGGIGGYYEIALPSPQTSPSVLVTFPQDIPLRDFEVRFAGIDANGAVGPSTAVSTSVTQVGTGDVQVTLSWDANSDVDLHVIDPAGEEVFYGNRTVASGGQLDLDSNAACEIDGVRNENITWPTGRAPVGRYTIRVDYWDSCGQSRTNYTVRVNAGGTPQITTGFFTGPGDQGGSGSGRLIGTFERQSASGRATFDVVVGEAAPTTVQRSLKSGAAK